MQDIRGITQPGDRERPQRSERRDVSMWRVCSLGQVLEVWVFVHREEIREYLGRVPVRGQCVDDGYF